VAWIATPFTVLPPPAAYLAWSVVTVGCLALTWWLLAPGPPLWRSTQLLGSLWVAPILLGLMLGQAAFLVLAAVAALAAAIAGSLLASPYLHPYDFTMLLASIWLVLRGSPPRRLAGGMLLAIPAAALLFTLGSLPLLAFAAGLAVAVALVPGVEHRRRGSVTELESAARA
jgi:hypothetical protein